MLAKADGESRARPVSPLGPSPDLADGTVLRTALRRRLHGDQWRETERVTIGGATRSLTPTGRLALQAIDARTVTSFGVLAAALEPEGIDQNAAAAAVAELVEQGLVMVSQPGC
jgi:hypothetical protein